jgi:hypothetical protein
MRAIKIKELPSRKTEMMSKSSMPTSTKTTEKTALIAADNKVF